MEHIMAHMASLGQVMPPTPGEDNNKEAENKKEKGRKNQAPDNEVRFVAVGWFSNWSILFLR